jgi:hypothetical protein
VAALDAVAEEIAGLLGWKASTPAVPATVAVRTIGERRMRQDLRT